MDLENLWWLTEPGDLKLPSWMTSGAVASSSRQWQPVYKLFPEDQRVGQLMVQPQFFQGGSKLVPWQAAEAWGCKLRPSGP